MTLNLKERLLVLQILPKESSFATLKIIQTLQSALGITEEEYKEFEVTQKDGVIVWNEKGLEKREVQIGEKAFDIIKESLCELDKQKKLTIEHLSLYEIFS